MEMHEKPWRFSLFVNEIAEDKKESKKKQKEKIGFRLINFFMRSFKNVHVFTLK